MASLAGSSAKPKQQTSCGWLASEATRWKDEFFDGSRRQLSAAIEASRTTAAREKKVWQEMQAAVEASLDNHPGHLAKACATQWHWVDKAGEPQCYDIKANAQLERGYRKWKASRSADDKMLCIGCGESEYIVDFETGMQRNVPTGVEWLIFREVLDGTDSGDEGSAGGAAAAGSSKTEPAAADAQWRWTSDEGPALCYDVTANAQLERAYLAWKSSDSPMDGSFRIRCEGAEYDVDLTTMMQRSALTGKQRPVFREVSAPAETATSVEVAPALVAEVPAEAASCPWREHIIKADFRGDVRRLRVRWATDAEPSEVLAAIQPAVREGFALPEGVQVQLHFPHSRPLMEADVADFVSQGQGGVLRLVVETDQSGEGGAAPVVEGADVTPPASLGGDVAGEGVLVQGFTMATPPGTPRGTIDDEYEFAWSLIEPNPPTSSGVAPEH
eukprot:NODE_5278_length_1788_cov_6.173992.p1 GENE.NODE_5278_length_1788_cov_6.173992~~NODE_5278_length_1788_cov_6.173992.p1  ORF type:complete len:459 (-),score=117.41 NODE_5278_length_1788_cov_6.173992:411-1742(-)